MIKRTISPLQNAIIKILTLKDCSEFLAFEEMATFQRNDTPSDHSPPHWTEEGRVKLTLPRMALKADGNTDGQIGRTAGEKCGLDQEHFGKLEDYRRQESVRHLLIDILFTTLCAVICGANNLKAVAHYAERKKS